MVNFTPTTEVVTTKAFSSYMVDVLCREDILSSEVDDSNQVFCTPVASETLFSKLRTPFFPWSVDTLRL